MWFSERFHKDEIYKRLKGTINQTYKQIKTAIKLEANTQID